MATGKWLNSFNNTVNYMKKDKNVFNKNSSLSFVHDQIMSLTFKGIGKDRCVEPTDFFLLK